jgi:hypothetical protein
VAVKWHEFDVEIALRDKMIGGIPVIPEGVDRADAYEKWARGQGVEDTGENDQTLAEALAAEPDMPVTADEVEGLMTSFRHDETGVYIEARQIKSMIREGAQRLGLIKSTRGMRQVIQHDVIVRAIDAPTPKDSQKIRLLDKDGAVKTEPDGRLERPISVITRQGPRTAIKRADYIEDAIILFRIKVLSGGVADGLMDIEKLQDVFDYAGETGLGADRSQGEGCFDVVSMTPVEAHPAIKAAEEALDELAK